MMAAWQVVGKVDKLDISKVVWKAAWKAFLTAVRKVVRWGLVTAVEMVAQQDDKWAAGKASKKVLLLVVNSEIMSVEMRDVMRGDYKAEKMAFLKVDWKDVWKVQYKAEQKVFVQA